MSLPRWCKVSDGAPRQAVDRSHGAPLRLRLERQLGDKMATYITRIELVQRLAELHGGRGGYREDRGYEWDAGIALQPNSHSSRDLAPSLEAYTPGSRCSCD